MATDFLPGNRLTLLNSGLEYFPALLAAIEAAQTEIYLESYIFADDEIGHEVTGALCRAASRGDDHQGDQRESAAAGGGHTTTVPCQALWVHQAVMLSTSDR